MHHTSSRGRVKAGRRQAAQLQEQAHCLEACRISTESQVGWICMAALLANGLPSQSFSAHTAELDVFRKLGLTLRALHEVGSPCATSAQG